ncbi:hypothetical protein SDC9_112568 [bioreactor metagenome]|uniref:Uncharacterized protein n=1 Tax=bioreactor metagenome TaxID=1076179 RepID=A0A645BMB0_9ZZZZ
MCMKKGSCVYNIDDECFVTISKLNLKIIETNKIGYNIVNSDFMRRRADLVLPSSEKAWKDINGSQKSINDGLEGMLNGH